MTGATAVDQRTAWIALAAVDGLGEHLVPRLAEAFGGAAEVLEVARTLDAARLGHRLRTAAQFNLRSATVEAVQAAAHDPHSILRRLAELDGWALSPWDAGYPPALRIIDPPPPVLFGVGDITALMARPLVAVVGTRRPTPMGRALAAAVAAALVRRGATVVSGLAIGIDGVAHATTLEEGGRTVAVIGGGLMHAGPRAHAALMAAIRRSGGAIVGEHPPDTLPTRGTFPRRNRIISGLSMATVVVEAPIGSGALITARHALEQGRPVFAATGRSSDRATAGCLALLRESPARPLVGVDELMLDLGLTPHGDAMEQDEGRAERGPGRPLHAGDALALLGPVERDVARSLLDGPASMDSLVIATGQSPAVVSGALTLLQLRGWVVPMGPMQVAAGPLLVSPPRRRTPGATRPDPT